MAEFYQFASDHPFLIWCIAWTVWPVCGAVRAVLTAPFRASMRRSRAQNIAQHGWPTNPHMNTDGDLVFPEINHEQ